jgi:hypothetical protein
MANPITQVEMKDLMELQFGNFEKVMDAKFDSKLEPVTKFMCELQSIKPTVEKLQLTVQTLSKSEKRNNVIIFGIPEVQNESNEDRDAEIEKLSTTLQVPKPDYDYAFRVGKRVAGRERPLLIRFLRLRDKWLIMQSTSKLKGTKIYINDDLTHEERYQQSFLRKKRMELTKADRSIKTKIRNNKLVVERGPGVVEVIYAEQLVEPRRLSESGQMET